MNSSRDQAECCSVRKPCSASWLTVGLVCVPLKPRSVLIFMSRDFQRDSEKRNSLCSIQSSLFHTSSCTFSPTLTRFFSNSSLNTLQTEVHCLTTPFHLAHISHNSHGCIFAGNMEYTEGEIHRVILLLCSIKHNSQDKSRPLLNEIKGDVWGHVKAVSVLGKTRSFFINKKRTLFLIEKLHSIYCSDRMWHQTSAHTKLNPYETI